MKLINLKNQSSTYTILIISLIFTLWLISLFEVYVTFSKGTELPNIGTILSFKFINDFWTGIILGLVFIPFYLVANTAFKKYGKIIILFLFAFVLVIQFSLVKYSLTTLLNLGADILGYSVSDVYITVTSSESMSLLYFLPFIIVPTLYFLIIRVFKKYVSQRQSFATLVVLVVIFGSLKLVFSQSSDKEYQNKLYFLASDIIRFQIEKNQANAYNLDSRNDYPYLIPFEETADVLSPFFNIQENKPNIVVIIVEGLGAEFVGENTYRGFTPYLDSLISKSLFWENFVSTSGRTFGVLPSLIGSLPLGETGFLELEKIPSHISLISVLKNNGYTTSFYAGDPSSFDKKINFLEYNGIDHVVDEDKFGPDFVKTEENSGGFSWGYPDAEIFKKMLSTLDGKKLPRLDIVMTLTNHEPFNFPTREVYLTKVDSILNSNRTLGVSKEEITANKNIFASLLYTDNSIKEFMSNYAKRPEYENTIFIITGDHRLIPITQKDKLCRFHVPMYIYSPMLNRSEKFKSISSHWDVAPSLFSFLMNNYKFNNLEKVAWMSEGLDTAKYFRNIHKIPLMRYKGNINDFIYKDYLYSDGELYKINESFGIYKVKEDELLKTVSDTLKEFKKLNAYITQRDKIYPDSLNIYVNFGIEFTNEEMTVIKNLTNGLDSDQIFELARDFAFDKNYKKSRLLINYILNQLPNHADARTLMGRTLAWEGKYKESETTLLNVIKRNPYYSDSYLALLDLYWWSNQDHKSVALAAKAFSNKLTDPEISFKLAKAYKRMDTIKYASKIIDSILKIHPENSEYQTFKQTLK